VPQARRWGSLQHVTTPSNEPYVSSSSSAGGPEGTGSPGPAAPAGSPSGAPALSRSSYEDRGAGLVGVGALLLFISLFLNWYEPGRSAWTVFEVWDLVLAVLSVVGLVGAAGRLGIVHRRPDSWLTGPAAAAFLIVLVSLVNHPPAATGAAPMFGLWLALLACVVMLVGVAISVGRVSVAINLHPQGAPPPTAGGPAAPASAPAAPRDRGRWFRHTPTPAPSPPPVPPPVPADRPSTAAGPSAADQAAPAEAPTEVTRPQPGRTSDSPQGPPSSP
jgi:hypothetical protein